jgi:opacity protein-like surface antigen
MSSSNLTTRGQNALLQSLVVSTLAAVLLLPQLAKANELLSPPALLYGSESTLQVPPGVLLAQNETDDAYDPFADYSEFEESMDEEEDINFFRNGRLLTLGFIGGYRGWTQTLGTIYTGNATFGLFLSYFFDLRFAIQLGYLTSDHTLVVKGAGFNPIQGTINISDLSLLLKYYFNTQNVTRGLADLNPYIVGGFSQIYRTETISGSTDSAKDSAFGFDIGAGVEIPMMRNKMYFGLQGLYQLISFADEGKVIQDDQGTKTGVSPAGDSFIALGIIGINF